MTVQYGDELEKGNFTFWIGAKGLKVSRFEGTVGLDVLGTLGCLGFG
jgi:hypothetical protein